MTAPVVEEALAMEPGDWAAALELLETTNRATPDDELQIALAALRHRGFDAVRAEDDGDPAGPTTSPAVGASGLPEADLAGLTAGQVRAAVLEHGCLLVRGAVAPDRAAALAESIDRSFAIQGLGDPEARSAWWWPLPLDDPAAAASLGRNWVRGGGGVLLVDSPRLMAEVLELYRELGLRQVVADYLGTRPVLGANKCTLRRADVTRNGDWHQDGAFLGPGVRAVNLWVTLTDCGVDAPGLDVVPRRLDAVVETGTGGAYFDWAVGSEVVQQVAGDAGVLRPVFEAGDLLVFDDLFLHRTAIDAAQMTVPRHAIELWAFAVDAYPSGQVPIVW